MVRAIAALVVILALVCCGQETDSPGYIPGDEMREIALDSGRWATYYIDLVTPWCEEHYGEAKCIVAVYELVKGRECGWQISHETDWPADLPDGKIYFIHMVDADGLPTGYQTISSGKKFSEVGDVSHDCWEAVGEYPPREVVVPSFGADAVRLSFSGEVLDKYERLAICNHLTSYLGQVPNGARPEHLL